MGIGRHPAQRARVLRAMRVHGRAACALRAGADALFGSGVFGPEQVVEGGTEGAADGDAELQAGVVRAGLDESDGLARCADGAGQFILRQACGGAGGLHAKILFRHKALSFRRDAVFGVLSRKLLAMTDISCMMTNIIGK